MVGAVKRRSIKVVNRRIMGLIVSLLLIQTALYAAGTNDVRPFSVEDFMKMRWVTAVQISPDGSRVLYAVDAFDMTNNLVRSSLWVVRAEGGEPHELADELSIAPYPDRTGAAWSPDGKQIAYLSGKEQGNQVWLVGASGGDARRMTSASTDVSYFKWSPDGKQIAYIANLPPAAKTVARRAPQVEGEGASPTTHIFLIDVSSRRTEQLTEAEHSPASLSWSPDSRQLVFSSQGDLLKVTLSDKKVTKLVERPGADLNPVWSPDGASIAFMSSHGEAGRPIGLDVVPAAGGPARNVGQMFDAWVNGPRYLCWSADGKALYFTAYSRMTQHLYVLNVASGEIRPLTSGPRVFFPMSVSPDSHLMAFIMSDPNTAGDVYISSTGGFRPRRLTKLNPGLASVNFGQVEPVRWKSADGLDVEGLLAKPVGYEAGKKYPLLVLMEGTYGTFDFSFSGRVSSDGLMWFPYQQQIFAGAGYAVLRPNPRGSWGYGEEFQKRGRGDFVAGPYCDIIGGVDHLISAGVADPNRLGIMGSGSFDAYRAAFATAQTNRFKAASVGPVPLFDLVSWYGQLPSTRFTDQMFGGPPWKVPERYNSISLVNLVDKISTPTLIFRASVIPWVAAQSDEMRTALTVNKVPVQYVIYPDDKPANAVYLTPNSLADAVARNLAWFDQWLKQIPRQ